MAIINYMDEKDIDFLPDSPFKKKLICINDSYRHPEIDKENDTLKFIIAKFSPEQFSEYVGRGYSFLLSQMRREGYVSHGGFHPSTYGVMSDGGCMHNCDVHHNLYKNAIMRLWDDEKYVERCKNIANKRLKGDFDTFNPEFRYIMSNYTWHEFKEKFKDAGWVTFANDLKKAGIHKYGSFCPKHYGYLTQDCCGDCIKCHECAMEKMKPFFKHRSRYA